MLKKIDAKKNQLVSEAKHLKNVQTQLKKIRQQEKECMDRERTTKERIRKIEDEISQLKKQTSSTPSSSGSTASNNNSSSNVGTSNSNSNSINLHQMPSRNQANLMPTPDPIKENATKRIQAALNNVSTHVPSASGVPTTLSIRPGPPVPVNASVTQKVDTQKVEFVKLELRYQKIRNLISPMTFGQFSIYLDFS